jgi:hypothetical protein
MRLKILGVPNPAGVVSWVQAPGSNPGRVTFPRRFRREMRFRESLGNLTGNLRTAVLPALHPVPEGVALTAPTTASQA